MGARTLENLARGHECYLRLVGVCNRNSETTVLAHIRRGGLGGMGIKPHSLSAAPLCSACHDAYDQRVETEYTRTELDAEMLRAHCQWLDWLVKQEIIIIGLAA